MAEAGIRELRNHLSRYLERVQAGEEIVVTDRGRAIAQMRPIAALAPSRGGPGMPRHAGETAEADAPTPLETTGTVSDLIAEQRR